MPNVIKEAKRITYNRRILKSNTTWNIINELLGKQQSTNVIKKLTIEGSYLTNQHDIADAFNNYFLSIIDNISSNSLDNMRQKNSFSTYSCLD